MIVVLNQFIVNLENYVTFAVFIQCGIRWVIIWVKSIFFINLIGFLQSFPNSVKRWGESEILLGNIFLSSDGDLRRSEFDQSNLFEG